MKINRNDVQKLIQKLKDDNVWNHFLCVIKLDCNVNGHIQKNKINIWKQGIWNKAFYPIFIFEFNSQNHLIKITDKLNPIGRLLYLLFPISYSIFFFSIIINDFKIKKFLILMTVILTILILYFLITKKIYEYEKKVQLEAIFKIIDKIKT